MASSVPRSIFAATFEKVKATKAANLIAERDEEQRRLTCPVEQAKNVLRQRGWIVFAAKVLPGRAGSKLIVVGKSEYRPEEVIAWADRLKRTKAA